MCGINGFTFRDPDLLRKMHAATRHRGPDDEGFFCAEGASASGGESDGISLAHNRLSIIDLSPAGRQPMDTPDGRYAIVFNGEIYNYRELRSDLEARGESFRTATDTEVLLRSYAVWGVEAFKKLNGIFACAIWDRSEKKLVLVRDPIGVKPLYYHYDGKRLLFSSEIKALLEAGVPRDMDREAMNQYFRLLYVPGPRTMFAEVKKLPPGTVGTFRNGSFDLYQYWTLEEGERIASYEEAVEGVRERTLASLRRQLVSDRPLGVFLSGGIDSSSIVGMMREVGVKDVKTFTIGYETEIDFEKFNADAKLAARTAEYFGTDHHAFTLSAQDYIDTMDEIVRHMDEPVANHIQPSTYLIAKYAKPDITVALGGDGGDELFGGYPRYWYARALGRLGWLSPLAQITNYKLQITNLTKVGSFLEKLAAKPGLERHLSFIAQKEAMVSRFLKKEVNAPRATYGALEPHFKAQWRDRVNQSMAVDISTWIPDESLVRTDKLTMAHALEERVPLLDVDLVSYASRIPSSYKLGTKELGKRVFIDAMRPYLPPHLLNEEKRAWMSPAAKWIRGPLQDWTREILSPDFNRDTAELFDFDAIQTIINRHISKEEYALAPIWSLVTFQLWWRQFQS